MVLCSFAGLGKQTRFLSDSEYHDSVGKPCQSAGSFWPWTQKRNECDSDTCLSALQILVTTCNQASSSCRLVPSLQWSDTALVHVMLVILREKSKTQQEWKLFFSARVYPLEQDGNTLTACCDLTQQTATAQAGHELWWKRRSGCELINVGCLKSTIK